MKEFIIGTAPISGKGQTAIKVNDPDRNVSRNHCQIIMYNNNEVFIEDIGSINGTYVNGQRINEPFKIDQNSKVLLAGKVPFNIYNYLPKTTEASSYAPFQNRLFAHLIDGFITGAIFFLLSSFFGVLFWHLPFLLLLLQLMLLVLIGYFYFVNPISSTGSTFGRRILKIEYLSLETLDYPTKLQIWLRLFGYFVSGLTAGIGFLLPLFTERKQALHDLIANTIVVQKQ
jgi:uncharacterized RDD family membrane protein YckC